MSKSSAFGDTKEYLFGKLTDTQANHIRVVRLFNKIVYERCGKDRRLFKRFKISKNDIPDLTGKFISTILILIFSPPLFLIFVVAFVFHIWNVKPDDGDLAS